MGTWFYLTLACEIRAAPEVASQSRRLSLAVSVVCICYWNDGRLDANEERRRVAQGISEIKCE